MTRKQPHAHAQVVVVVVVVFVVGVVGVVGLVFDLVVGVGWWCSCGGCSG